MNVTDLTIKDAAALICERKLSPVELTSACLRRIEERNSELNAFITVMARSALEQARTAESQIGNGHWRGPLHGIPIALKDLIDTAGVRTTAASALFADRVPKEDAEVVRRLKAAGAVIIGKTNLHEFAYGGSSLISYFGPVRNPVNPEYIAGGSSGGSAAAVASGMCLGAIGTDTAGSIRVPAAYCGIVGLKPTFGLVSAEGVIPLAWSYDHVGPMTKTVEDAAILFEAIASECNLHAGRVRHPFVVDESGLKKVRVGVAREFFDGVDAEISAAVINAIAKVGEAVADIREIAFRVDDDRTASNYESYAYHRDWVSQSPELYQPSTLARIQAGAEVSGEEYEAAKQHLHNIRVSAAEMFCEADVVITPTVPVPPAKSSEFQTDMNNLRKREVVMLRNTRPFNILGVPAISVPCGKTENGLPIGVQIAAVPGREDLVLAVASYLTS